MVGSTNKQEFRNLYRSHDTVSRVKRVKVRWISHVVTKRVTRNVTYSLRQCFSNCGPRQSAGGFGRISIAKIVSDTERMKNTPVYACAITTSVTLPSSDSTRTSYFHKFLSFMTLENIFNYRIEQMWLWQL
jgi:hypothetical protein